jgi:hypothetical protein
MTDPKKNVSRDELDRIEEALVQAILDSSEAELREDMNAAGEEFDKCLAEFDALIAGAKATSAKRRFDQAKSELKDWRATKGNVVGFDRDAVRARFEKIRARDPELASRMMMAARNGQGLSDSDIEGLLEDLARLERLSGEGGDE